MELKKNSITTKLYLWFYNKTANDLPESLCPYFWQLVIMWIFIMPLAISQIPYFIMRTNKITKNIFGYQYHHLGRIAVSMVTLIAIFTIICIVYSIFTLLIYGLLNDLFQFLGIFFLIITLICTMIFGCMYLYDKIKERNSIIYQKYIWTDDAGFIENPKYVGYDKIKKQNIIKEFLKAKYNKYCPRITWK